MNATTTDLYMQGGKRMFDTQDKLENYLRIHGIVGAWVDRDADGFTRRFRFEVGGVECVIWWFPNFSEIRVSGVAEYWFDRCSDEINVPVVGKWLCFQLGANDKGLMLKIA